VTGGGALDADVAVAGDVDAVVGAPLVTGAVAVAVADGAGRGALGAGAAASSPVHAVSTLAAMSNEIPIRRTTGR
jgi:hypothetical protein